MKNPFKRNSRRVIDAQIAQLREIAALMQESARQVAIETSAPMLRKKLSELDPRLLDLLIDQSRYTTVYGTDPTIAGNRTRAVEASRFVMGPGNDIQIKSAADTWTDWGFGRELDIVAIDDDANVVWQECWKAARNRAIFGQSIIHELSNQVLRDGELFFIGYTSRQDGSTTWRVIDTLSVPDIIHAKNDDRVNVWYVVDMDSKQVAIPDAFTYFALRDRFENVELPDTIKDINAIEPTLDNGGTFVSIVPAQRNRGTDCRGWPEFYGAIAWSDVYAQMLREYSAVFSAVAMYVDKLKIDGGSQTMTDIITQLQSSLVTGDDYRDTNPTPAAGSTWMENQAADRTRMPLGSAAGDAQAGTMVIGTQLATALGVKLSDIGRPDAFQNKSVADSAAEGPEQRWQRYQIFWASIWQNLVETTLHLSETFTKEKFKDYSSRVSMSLPMSVATTDIATAMKTVNESVAALTLDFSTAQAANNALLSLMLIDLGVGEVQEIVQPNAREIRSPIVTHLHESHTAVEIEHICPLCGHNRANSYAGHGSLLVCASCGRTYDPEVE